MGSRNSWKFVHAADLHIDSPMRGLVRYDSAPVEEFRQATRTAFASVVDLCLNEKAEFLLLAGDVFDGDWRDYNTGLFFRGELTRLGDAGIPVFIVRGNHDAASEVTRNLELPAGVHEFPEGEPTTALLPDLEAAIHGQSFATRSMSDNLARAYPEPIADHLNIGLLHSNVGSRPGHDDYAPCSLDDLTSKGYDYWALGHVHEAEVLSRDPWIVYPGCTQGRSVRETGPKGCALVTVEAARIAEVLQVTVDVVRWAVVEVELSEDSDSADLLAQAQGAIEQAVVAAEGRPLALRMHISGPLRDYAELERDDGWERLIGEVRALAQDVSGDAWIEKTDLSLTPAVSLERLRAQGGVVSELVRRLDAMVEAEEPGHPLKETLAELGNRPGIDLADLGLDPSDEEGMVELLTSVRSLLAARLAGDVS